MIYEFTPTQDLHGYESPWPAGGGKNQYNGADIVFSADPSATTGNGIALTKNSDESFTVVGTATADTRLNTRAAYDFKAGKSYTISVRGLTNGNIRIVINGNVSGSGLDYTDAYPTSDFSKTYTITADCGIAYFFIDVQSGATVNNTLRVQIEEGQLTDWTPYSNICPIRGYDIWDPSQKQMIPVYSGYVDADANKLYLHPVYEEYDGEELVGPWMSSLDKYSEEGTPTTGAFVVDFGGEVSEYAITDFQLQTLLDSLGIRRFISSGAMLLNSLMDQAQGRVRSEAELLNRSFPIHVIAIGKELPTTLVIKKHISDVLPVLPGKTKI